MTRRGFSMIEVMVALGVLAVAVVGALTGLIAASNQLRMGQNTSRGTILAERLIQRMKLANKTSIINASVTYTGGGHVQDLPAATTAPTAANPWRISTFATGPLGDLSDDASADFSRGAFFTIDGRGVVARYVPPGGVTTCGQMLVDATVPHGVFCREYAITRATTITAATGTGMLGAVPSAEVLVRVFRKRDRDPTPDVWVISEVVVQ